ncbi:MAG: sigma 54-interacting transcriptional regulator, partial [Candidatus Eisenbacteria bacterium]
MIFEIPDIQRIEKRLEILRSVSASTEYLERLELLADLYLSQDGYQPALEYLEEILSHSSRIGIPEPKRIRLKMKTVECLIRRSRCEEALDRCKLLAAELGQNPEKGLQLGLGLLLSHVHWKLGNYALATTAAEAALDLSIEMADERSAAECHNALGKSYLRLGQPQAAREHFEDALAVYKRLKDKTGIAVAHNNLGLLHKNRCEWQLASDHLKRALELDREIGNYGKTAYRLLNLGLVHYRTCRWQRAKSLLEEALSVAVAIGDQHTCAAVYIAMGNCARLLGDSPSASTLYEQARLIAEKERLMRELALAHEFTGESELMSGNATAALESLDRALDIAQSIAPEGDIVAEVERRRAEALLEQGDLKGAHKALKRCLELCCSLGDAYEEAEAIALLGRLRAAKGQRRSAAVAFRSATVRLESVGNRYGLARCLLSLGRFLLHGVLVESSVNEARRALTRAAGLFAELGTHSLLEQAEKELERAWVVPEADGPSVAVDGRSGQGTFSTHGFVTCDSTLLGVVRFAERLCATDTRVLIQGETGVGKNLLAYVFKSHEEAHGRCFVELNCASIPGELLESELFGYAKGAFSGAVAEKKGILEDAQGGTLFLNEIGEMDSRMQAKLLQVLDDGCYRRVGETLQRTLRARIVSATNKELWGEVERGTFRRDLYFRLAQAVLTVTPLRERIGDVAVLAHYFVETYAGLHGKLIKLDARAIESLQDYSWPGNVRELRNRIQLLAIDAPRKASLSQADVEKVLWPSDSGLDAEADAGPGTLAAKVESLKRAEISRALTRYAGNRTKAAHALGLSRRGLFKMVERMRLDEGGAGPSRPV